MSNIDFKEYSELYHHGVKGMHWGVRRYQNEDGTLTSAGRKRYEKDLNKLDAKASQHYADAGMYANKADATLNKAKNVKSDRKKTKLANKAVKYRNKADQEYAKGKEYESEQWKGIGDALGRGSNVTTRSTERVNRRFATYNALSGPAGGAVGSLIASAAFQSKYGKYYNGVDKATVNGMKIKGNKFTLSEGIPGKNGEMITQIDLSKYYKNK